MPSPLSSSPSSSSPSPWTFSHRDVFDLIGKHKYDHTLPELLTSLAAPQGGGGWVGGWVGEWMGRGEDGGSNALLCVCASVGWRDMRREGRKRKNLSIHPPTHPPFPPLQEEPSLGMNAPLPNAWPQNWPAPGLCDRAQVKGPPTHPPTHPHPLIFLPPTHPPTHPQHTSFQPPRSPPSFHNTPTHSNQNNTALGVVTHYLYRTFLHPHELNKAWTQLHRSGNPPTHPPTHPPPSNRLILLHPPTYPPTHPPTHLQSITCGRKVGLRQLYSCCISPSWSFCTRFTMEMGGLRVWLRLCCCVAQVCV